MGTNYYLVDDVGRRGLDIGKWYALPHVASLNDSNKAGVVVTLEHVREAAAGWWTTPFGDHPARLVDAWPWASSFAERWIAEVASGPVRIVSEGNAPWGTEYDPAPGWDLWTFYVHPLTKKPSAPWKLWNRHLPAFWLPLVMRWYVEASNKRPRDRMGVKKPCLLSEAVAAVEAAPAGVLTIELDALCLMWLTGKGLRRG